MTNNSNSLQTLTKGFSKGGDSDGDPVSIDTALSQWVKRHPKALSFLRYVLRAGISNHVNVTIPSNYLIGYNTSLSVWKLMESEEGTDYILLKQWDLLESKAILLTPNGEEVSSYTYSNLAIGMEEVKGLMDNELVLFLLMKKDKAIDSHLFKLP